VPATRSLPIGGQCRAPAKLTPRDWSGSRRSESPADRVCRRVGRRN
jgi:hypothetical protein